MSGTSQLIGIECGTAISVYADYEQMLWPKYNRILSNNQYDYDQSSAPSQSLSKLLKTL